MSIIAVLGGTGSLGGALARRWAQAGHEVWIGSRDAGKAQAAAAAMLEEASGLNIHGAALGDAAAHAEIVVLAVPYASQVPTVEAIKGHVGGKIVIDTTAPLKPPKVGTVQLPAAGCAAVEVQALLGDEAQVASAMQTVSAEKLGHSEHIEADVLVAADKKDIADTVIALIADLGLRGYHAGPLANSAASEALTSVLIQLNRRYFSHAGIRITGDPKGDKPASKTVQIIPVTGLPLFQKGDDLAAAITFALRAQGELLYDGDVLVIAQKIVSKAEGRAVRLADVTPSDEAQALAAAGGKHPAVAELILRESANIMRAKPGVIIARHKLGTVSANAGIDASNVEHSDGETVLLWPENPDASAAAIRATLQKTFGTDVAIIISDSLGRAWRLGTTGTAIGTAGIAPLTDRRGEADLFGRTLQATIIGRADELAAAASLVIGEAAEATPVAIIRNAPYVRTTAGGIGASLRPADEDLFP
jgi:coenzyme F420-0:L-glutamate ligase / coenzyme F420-1:gamma-L-glutamate ligase